MGAIVSVNTLLFSSNATAKYAQDILTVLASPPGAVVRFRYDSKYVDGDLQNDFGSKAILGRDVVIAFLDSSSAIDSMLPIRVATVTAGRRVPGAYVLELSMKWIPDLSSWPAQQAAFFQHAAGELAKVRSVAGSAFSAVSRSGVQLTQPDDDAGAWQDLVRRLAFFPTFADTYFMRTEILSRTGSKPPRLTSSGELVMKANIGFILRCWFYGEKYDPSQGSITVSVDESVLKIASDVGYKIQSRYDQVDFWFRSQALKGDSITYVNLSLPDTQSASSLPTFLRFPVVVKRSRTAPLLAGLIGGAGAALVAAPAILGSHSPLDLRLALAVGGALVIAVFAAWTSRR